MPRTARDVVRDLHTLPATARVPGPYILVGHSMGGIFVRLYAPTYPRQVRGMVLVEAFGPRLKQRFGPLWPGYLDLVNRPPPGFAGNRYLETVNEDASIARLGSAPPLPPMPLSVISKGKPLALPPSLPAGINHPGIERVWTSAQNDLVTLQPGTPHVVAEQSDHYVQMHRPDLVIARIRRVLDPTRR